MSGPLKEAPRIHINRSLVITVILFVLAGCCMIVLTNTAINMLSASRSYTAMQAMWSQSQHTAVNQLSRYAHSGDEYFYREYQTSLESIKGIRMALDELHVEHPDPKVIYRGFDKTRLHPADITGMITAFKRFGYVTDLESFYQKWNRVYEKAGRLDELGQKVRRVREQHPPDQAAIENTMKEIRMLSEDLMTEKRMLLIELSTQARNIRQLAIWLIVFVGIILVITGVLVSVRVSKSVRQWREVLEERTYLASFPENNPTPIVHVDSNGKVIYQNAASRKLFPELTAKKERHPFLHDISRIRQQADADQNVISREVQVGKATYQQTIFYVEPLDALYVYAVDITHQKKSEQRVRKSLREKEILLGEIHHRVKNNLAVVSGLLEMQMMQMQDEEARQALKDSQARIQSMATIHEILYDSDRFSEVNLRSYLNELKEYILGAYQKNGTQIEIQAEVEDVQLNINQAIPCGLILNELMSNAIQHGFDHQETGLVRVQLTEVDNRVMMAVEDNGKGLPADFDYGEASSMGMTIIDTLIKQLGGELEIKRDPVTKFSITFEKSDAAGSSNNLF